MAQQKSWAMSAIVAGTYVCAVCFAGGPALSPRGQTAKGSRPPASRPVLAMPAVQQTQTPTVAVADAGQ